jgi:hypothetical protein
MSLSPAYTPLNWVNLNPGAAAITILNQLRTGETSRALQGAIVVTGLSGTGSLLTVTRSVGGVAQLPVEIVVPVGQASIEIPIGPFVARDDLAVGLTLRSDNAADSSVSGSTTLWPNIDFAGAVDLEELAESIAPLVLPSDGEGAHIPDSRIASLIRRGSSLYSETPLPIKAGENGAHAPLFGASFAKDLAGGGGIYQVTSVTVVTTPEGAGEEDLVIVGNPKRNGPEARFILAAADDATVGRYQLLVAVVYAGGAGGAEAIIDVNVGAAS